MSAGIKSFAASFILLFMTLTGPSLHAEIAALLPRLRRFARVLAWQREDADDLVQIAVERALQHSAQWQAGTRLDSWLFRIMKNAWVDEVRVRMRRERVFVAEQEGEHVGDNFSETQQQGLALRQALSLLSEEHQMAVALVLVDGLSYKEAADVLEIPIGTLMSRLARARAALQGLLSDQARVN